MTSKIHLQRTNESARCYDNVVSKPKLMIVNQEIVANCARKLTVSHIHDIHDQQYSNRIELQFSGHVFCWSCILLVMYLIRNLHFIMERFAFRVAANDADTLKDELSVTRKEVKRLIPYLSKLAQIVLLLDEEIILYERLNGSRRQNKFN